MLAAAKDARRLQLETEIKALGFKPGEGKRPPSAAVKYHSIRDPTKTWAARGVEPTWLKAEPAKWAMSGANQALCPDGSYMVGISVTSKDSAAPGGISAVQPICRQLNTTNETSAKPK